MSDEIKVKGGWVFGALGVASTLIQAGNYAKLKALEEKGQQAEFEKMFQAYIKDAFFKLKSQADDAAAEEKSNPKFAAAVLKMLSNKIEKSPIQIEHFTELQDKEYVSNARKFIFNRSKAANSKLSEEESTDVQDAIEYYEAWSVLEKYVNDYYEYQAYKQALSKSSNSIGCIFQIIMFILSGIIPSLAFSGRNSTGSTFGLFAFIAFGMFVGSIVWWLVERGTKKKAKNQVEVFKQPHDVETLREIDVQYKGSRDEAQSQMEANESAIVELIGKMPGIE